MVATADGDGAVCVWQLGRWGAAGGAPSGAEGPAQQAPGEPTGAEGKWGPNTAPASQHVSLSLAARLTQPRFSARHAAAVCLVSCQPVAGSTHGGITGAKLTTNSKPVGAWVDRRMRRLEAVSSQCLHQLCEGAILYLRRSDPSPKR